MSGGAPLQITTIVALPKPPTEAVARLWLVLQNDDRDDGARIKKLKA
jgi:hypothetical protein